MASDKDISIGIKTTGADAAVADLNRVKGASESITKGQLAPGNSLGARDDAGRERALRDIQALTDKAKVSEIAFYDLGAKINAVDKPLGKLGSTAAGTVGGLSKTGFVANQVSMQVGDFAQQVTGGTSALRAFSQQAPQLIGTFASMGKLTGPVGLGLMAVAALLPLITQGFSAISASFGTVAENADDSKQRMDDLGTKISEIQSKHLNKFKENLEESQTHAANLKIDMKGLRDAESEAAQTIITNAGKMAEAEEKINVILGIRVDHFAKIKEANALARAQREKDLAEAQQKAANDRKEKEDQLAILRKELDDTKADYAKEQEAMKRREARIGPMQENRAKQEKISQERPGVLDYLDSPVYAMALSEKADTAAAEYKRLDTELAKENKDGERNREGLARFSRGIRELESKIEGATNQLAIDQQAAETKLGTLIQTQETSKVVELADTAQKYQEKITSTAQQLKTDLEAAAEKQGSLSATAASSLAIITKQLENNVIDPNELQQFATAMSLAKSSREAVTSQILGGFAQLQASDAEIRNALLVMQKQFEEMNRARK